jgi:hypothetical protein
MAGLTGYLRPAGVGVGVAGTCGASGAALSREVGAGAVGTLGAFGAALRREVGAGATRTRGAPGAALRREVGAGAMGTRGAPGAALSREVGAGATGTRGTPGAALSWEVGTGAPGTCGAPGTALSQEVGVGAVGIRGAPRAAPPPFPHPSVRGQGLVVPVTSSDNPHWMTTWGKIGFRVVPNRLVLTAATPSPTPSPTPSSARAALADPRWRAAMEEEYDALISNGTWELVPRPQGSSVVTGKWVFTHKLRADGTLDHYKARWVLRGFTQLPGVDYDETFSPVVKPTTIRMVLATAVSCAWPIQQLDVKNTFLHGILSKTVFCCQPTGFADSAHPDLVCYLHKSLYGLKQAPRAWYSRFATFLTTLGFIEAKSGTSLFIFHRGSDTIYLLLYMDDIILTASSTELLRRTIFALQWEFTMKDLGSLHHFLGITVECRLDGLFLHQRTYTLEIFKRVVMADCKLCTTPVDLQSKLAGDSGPPIEDVSQFWSIAGALQYLTFTRPDIAYAMQQICLHMHDPREPHLTAMKRILPYLHGTPDYSLLLRRSSSSDLVVYTDADWAGCLDTCRFTSGYAVFLGDNLVSWSAKRQTVVTRSSAEAEYRAVANGVAGATWLRQLLHELQTSPSQCTIVYCDNISAVYLSTNSVQHHCTKHVEIDLHFVREKVVIG